MRAEIAANPEHAELIRASYGLGGIEQPSSSINISAVNSGGNTRQRSSGVAGPILPVPEAPLPVRQQKRLDVDQINRLREQGLSWRQIESEIGSGSNSARRASERGQSASAASALSEGARAQFLLDMARAGQSYAQIAAALSTKETPITRNMVAGKLTRLRRMSEVQASPWASLPDTVIAHPSQDDDLASMLAQYNYP